MLDPQGMEETRLRAQALLCRVFLVYLSEKGEEEDITELWLGVIDVLDRLMNSGKPDQLVSLFFLPPFSFVPLFPPPVLSYNQRGFEADPSSLLSSCLISTKPSPNPSRTSSSFFTPRPSSSLPFSPTLGRTARRLSGRRPTTGSRGFCRRSWKDCSLLLLLLRRRSRRRSSSWRRRRRRRERRRLSLLEARLVGGRI